MGLFHNLIQRRTSASFDSVLVVSDNITNPDVLSRNNRIIDSELSLARIDKAGLQKEYIREIKVLDKHYIITALSGENSKVFIASLADRDKDVSTLSIKRTGLMDVRYPAVLTEQGMRRAFAKFFSSDINSMMYALEKGNGYTDYAEPSKLFSFFGEKVITSEEEKASYKNYKQNLDSRLNRATDRAATILPHVMREKQMAGL